MTDVDPKEYEKLRDLLDEKCSWIEYLNGLYGLVNGYSKYRQSILYMVYSLYQYLMFGEPIPCTLTAEEWKDFILDDIILRYDYRDYKREYEREAGKIESFVKSLNPIKVKSLRRTVKECERVGRMKLSEIKEEVKAWANSTDERLRRAAEMTLEEFAKSEIWRKIDRDLDIFNIKFGEYTVADVWELISIALPMLRFFEREIINVLWKAGLVSRYAVDRHLELLESEKREYFSDYIPDVFCEPIEVEEGKFRFIRYVGDFGEEHMIDII